MQSSVADQSLDFLFVHVPKPSNYYKPLDEFTFINYIPMGVFAICDLLNRHAVRSRIKHLGLETILDESFSIGNWVKDHKVPVVGLSLHWHYQSFDVIDVAQKIKIKNPDTVIVLGGLTASRFAEEILREFEYIDAVITGDAEGGIVPFAQTALTENKNFEQVKNCVWRKPSGEVVHNGTTYVADAEALSALDYANLSLLDNAQKYREYYRMPMFWMNHETVSQNLKMRLGAESLFPLALGRGCPANCTFCGGGSDAQKSICNRPDFSVRSVDSVIETMKSAVGHGYTGFITCFEPTPEDDRWNLEWLKAIGDNGITCGVTFECWGLPSEAFIRSFKENTQGSRSLIALSPETGSEKVRRENKSFYYSNEALYKTMETLLECNVSTILYFTAGIPGESASDIQETVALSKDLKKRFGKIIDGIFCLPVQIEPGAPLFENPDKYGVDSKRSCFLDFYNSHGRCDSGPYDYLGYVTDALKEADGDMDAFLAHIQKEQCKHFCTATPAIIKKLGLEVLSPYLCKMRHKQWKKKGFGEVATGRRTFSS
ncbi:MAG: radical SAM protein [Fibrobacterales bacterium]